MNSTEQNFLFVGVGGMGMAPLACWMSRAGYSVIGCDAHLQESVRLWLTHSGVELKDFILPEQVIDFSTVVYSSAVSQEHPLLVCARKAGLRCLKRGEMLNEITRDKKLIAVVGSHGKTTTCGMIAHGSLNSGIEIDYIIGGLFADPSIPPARCCGSDWIVAEVDESDGTIDLFSPEVTLVLNIDWDHADYYDDASKLNSAFTHLLERTRQTILAPSKLHFEPLGSAVLEHFDDRIDQLGMQLNEAGRFNRMNADAAAAVLALFNSPIKKDNLTSFTGMLRRQSTLYSDANLTLVEDYAHHPTEIYALIECLKKSEPEKELIVVFQPHRYSRTRQFKNAFVNSLQAADRVFLLPVYAAHEIPVDGGDTSALRQAFSSQIPVELEMSFSGMNVLAGALCGSPAQIAFVGAGDIGEFAAAFVSWLRPDFSSRHTLDAALIEYLKSRVSPGCRLKLQEPLAKKTTIRIGGNARFFSEPANLSDLHVLLKASKIFGIRTFCLGQGSNILVPDHGFDGLIIRFSATGWRRIEALGEGRIWAAAGGRLKQICGFAAKQQLSGFEFLEGIPGAIGGALRMNAGAMGSWIFDLVERVQFIDEFGHYQDLPKSAFHFGYRKVEEISRGIALGAILSSAEVSTQSSIRGRIDSYSTIRKESQPHIASAGCIFKNPEGNYAGKLIDELGIKGMRVGAAEVSDIHGNFIVNNGGAKAADVIELIRRIRAKVETETGYVLEPEVLLVGQSWEDTLDK